ncbi:MAG: 2OG-Fe(II) oxygenase [Alphaproteobacteria bacterium]|nr:2OG-Fe(II) oxygenase [Alphaproteobacteria bacterium]
MPEPPHAARKPVATAPVSPRLDHVDWEKIAAALDARGYATTPPLLDGEKCRGLAALYAEDAPFRSRVVMQRHAFGQGEYKYFDYPLPPLVQALRSSIYPHLAPVANRWRAALGEGEKFPPTLDAFLAECHAAGQPRPTPLLLQYGADDYNCLHQDLYGPLVFPLQLTVLLSDPAHDFSGGEFVLVEQRPRAQSKAEVVPLAQGAAVIFAVHHRPVRGTRGWYRVMLRHGVSRVRSGSRHTLGIIFHDAR